MLPDAGLGRLGTKEGLDPEPGSQLSRPCRCSRGLGAKRVGMGWDGMSRSPFPVWSSSQGLAPSCLAFPSRNIRNIPSFPEGSTLQCHSQCSSLGNSRFLFPASPIPGSAQSQLGAAWAGGKSPSRGVGMRRSRHSQTFPCSAEAAENKPPDPRRGSKPGFPCGISQEQELGNVSRGKCGNSEREFCVSQPTEEAEPRAARRPGTRWEKHSPL